MNNIGRKSAALLLLLSLLICVPTGIQGAARDNGNGAAPVLELLPCSAQEAGIPSVINEESCDTAIEVGVTLRSRLLDLLFGDNEQQADSSARPTLIVGGGIFGTRIKESHVSVATADESGVLHEGDKILSIDGLEIRSISDIKSAVKASGGRELSITCIRSGKRICVRCTPKEVGGEYRLGAVLREGASGIGTVTYVDPTTGEFGGLGHGICNPDTGEVIEMTGGNVTDVILGGVVKGEEGKPGELTGILTDRPLGEIYANTECGVFGRLDTIPKGCGELTPIAYRSEVHNGDAKIISTLKNGATMEYGIRISEVKPASTGTKSFRVTVTDPALLAISGGIVRGMSGSPIIQDGKLVGAVTHVLVAEPTEGYGIFIENMLSAAKQNILPKAA